MPRNDASLPPELPGYWAALSADQRELVMAVCENLSRPIKVWRSDGSDVIPSDRILNRIGDHLKTHHVLSAEPFRKEKFEYALKRTYEDAGRHVEWSESRTEIYDLKVDGKKWSLKSQADKKIQENILFLSKMMELGSILWNADPDSLVAVREYVLKKIARCDRIIVLRCLSVGASVIWKRYELIEIPKKLFERAKAGSLSISPRSRQTPPCARCVVTDHQGTMFEFYFDGGTEMKLQLKRLRKDLCILHATWEFEMKPPDDAVSSRTEKA